MAGSLLAGVSNYWHLKIAGQIFVCAREGSTFRRRGGCLIRRWDFKRVLRATWCVQRASWSVFCASVEAATHRRRKHSQSTDVESTVSTTTVKYRQVPPNFAFDHGKKIVWASEHKLGKRLIDGQ